MIYDSFEVIDGNIIIYLFLKNLLKRFQVFPALVRVSNQQRRIEEGIDD